MNLYIFRFLEEIGFDDIFSSLNEQQENNNNTNNKSMNLSNFSNNKTDNMQEYEKNLTPLKEPSFGAQIEALPPKKPGSRDITPSSKQKQNAILPDKSPQNTSKSLKSLQTYELKCSLKSHLDGVRDLFFYNNDEILVSASEDCLIKLWDLKAIENNSPIDPYFSLREHTGPLFTITGSVADDKPNIIFSAGSEVFIYIICVIIVHRGTLNAGIYHYHMRLIIMETLRIGLFVLEAGMHMKKLYGR